MLWGAGLRSTAMSSRAKMKNIFTFREKWSWEDDNNENVVEKVQLHPLRIVLAWIWGILGFWLLFIPTIKAIKLTVSYKNTEMVITNKKAIEKYGWIKVHCDEMGFYIRKFKFIR